MAEEKNPPALSLEAYAGTVASYRVCPLCALPEVRAEVMRTREKLRIGPKVIHGWLRTKGIEIRLGTVETCVSRHG